MTDFSALATQALTLRELRADDSVSLSFSILTDLAAFTSLSLTWIEDATSEQRELALTSLVVR